MGLETAHPDALARLNKRMTLAGFDRAAEWLVRHGIAVRAFVLVHPPFVTRAEAAADRLAGGSAEDDFDAGETLQEAESEIGMAEWIDPDTGVPAEDNVPRLEDH